MSDEGKFTAGTTFSTKYPRGCELPVVCQQQILSKYTSSRFSWCINVCSQRQTMPRLRSVLLLTHIHHLRCTHKQHNLLLILLAVTLNPSLGHEAHFGCDVRMMSPSTATSRRLAFITFCFNMSVKSEHEVMPLEWCSISDAAS